MNELWRHKRSKEQYKKRKGVIDYQFKEGDKDLRSNMKQKTRKGSKHEDRWLGPYTIVEISTTTCCLANVLGKNLKTRINHSQLKPYLGPLDNKHVDTTESEDGLADQSGEDDEPIGQDGSNQSNRAKPARAKPARAKPARSGNK